MKRSATRLIGAPLTETRVHAPDGAAESTKYMTFGAISSTTMAIPPYEKR